MITTLSDNPFQSIQSGLAVILQIGITMLALLLCFTGYRMVRQWVSFIAFVFGGVMGFSAAKSAGLGKEYWYLPLIIALAAGIVLSLFGYKLFQLGLFVFSGAVSSFRICHTIPSSS